MYTPRQIWRQVTPKAQVLIAVSLSTVLAFSAGLSSGLYGRSMYAFLAVNRAETAPATAPMTASNQAAPLGIALPAGAQRGDLPTGLTDYLRPSNPTSTIGMQSHPLGIDLPRGANVHDLPRGLTDYVRPQPPAVAAPRKPNVPISGTGSAYDGQTHHSAHPVAVLSSPALIGTGSAYDGGHYTSAPAVRKPNVPISGTGSAYDGGAYGITRPTTRTWPAVPVAGTGSAYDGWSYTVPRVAPQPVRDGPGLHSTGSADALDTAQQGVMDYLRAHNQ